MTPDLALALPGFTWRDLFVPERLAELHEKFLADLALEAPDVAERFAAYRRSLGEGMKPEAISAVLCDVAPHVSAFVARLFRVEDERRSSMRDADHVAPVFRMKDQLVKRRALKRGEVAFDAVLDAAARKMLSAAGVTDPDDERAVALFACDLLDLDHDVKRGEPRAELAKSVITRVHGAVEGAAALPDSPPYREATRTTVAACLDLLERWLLMRRRDPAIAAWMAFRLPQPMDFDQLVQIRRPIAARAEEIHGPESHRRHRDGFALTDERMNPMEVRDHVEYCLYCHERDKDTCSKGFRDKDGSYKANPLGIPLAGCPLDEKISEMHLLRKQGDSIGALALV
ncbi:MAG: pyridine nucleotide-disulfide oxidoreductase, partial [Deltaproteobacteria bacterium]|nr:pyridine nucleotide-disulfide oxidoreductase [Deltaproteobacteria bacterium]